MIELIELLETALPRRFGGGPGDYQLVEREEGALTRLELVVRPDVGELDEQAVAEAALEFLGRDSEGNRMMAEVWRQGGTLRVARREPHVTAAAKTPTLHRVRG